MRNASEDYLIILKKAFGPTTLMYRNPNRAWGIGHGVIRQRTEDAGKTGCQLEVRGRRQGGDCQSGSAANL